MRMTESRWSSSGPAGKGSMGSRDSVNQGDNRGKPVNETDSPDLTAAD